jgi:hypothetical protein
MESLHQLAKQLVVQVSRRAKMVRWCVMQGFLPKKSATARTTTVTALSMMELHPNLAPEPVALEPPSAKMESGRDVRDKPLNPRSATAKMTIATGSPTMACERLAKVHVETDFRSARSVHGRSAMRRFHNPSYAMEKTITVMALSMKPPSVPQVPAVLKANANSNVAMASAVRGRRASMGTVSAIPVL